MTAEIAQHPASPVRPDDLPPDAHREFAIGLLELIGEVLLALTGYGVVPAAMMQRVLEDRVAKSMAAGSPLRAAPAQALADVMRLVALPRQLAFPGGTEGNVVDLAGAREARGGTDDPGRPAA